MSSRERRSSEDLNDERVRRCLEEEFHITWTVYENQRRAVRADKGLSMNWPTPVNGMISRGRLNLVLNGLDIMLEHFYRTYTIFSRRHT